MGLIPCNMVSEIRAEDEETLDQLIKQGFLPLSTPVDRIGTTRVCSLSWTSEDPWVWIIDCMVWIHSASESVGWKVRGRLWRKRLSEICHLLSFPEQNRRGLRRDQASRRMVALYDYDPRESSPNVDVEVSLTAKDPLLNTHMLTDPRKCCIRG